MQTQAASPWTVALIGLAVTAAACSRPDPEPPVARVSLTVNRTSIPLGGPLELTYRFEVSEGPSIAEDYRVFVHVTRDDGTTIWNDDHDLPAGLGTSTWRPGQVIEYSRTRFVPNVSYLGEASIRVGLYRDNRRLPLAGPEERDRESTERSYLVGTVELLPRSESLQLIRLSGWHLGEYPPDDPYVEWQWTQKVATISLRNPKRDLWLYLEFDGRPDVFDPPQQLTVFAGETAVETVPVGTPAVMLRKIPIPAKVLGTGEMAELRLVVDRTFVPSRLAAGAQDDRELGIRVLHLFAEPR